MGTDQIVAREISWITRSGSADVAPFSEVAKVPSFDEHKLAYFLLAPHPTMPEMALSRSAAADIAAYIAKQAPDRERPGR